jgi:hypothetical protein
MRFAIVGEGPIGLITCLYLIYLKHTLELSISIKLFAKRPIYSRRHIVNVTHQTFKKIESFILKCKNCLTTAKEIEEISINCLESLLYKNVKAEDKYIDIITRGFEKDDIKSFDHVIICDGFKSITRTHINYSNKQVDNLNLRTGQLVILFYYNLKPLKDSLLTKRCLTDESEKEILTNDSLKVFGFTIVSLSSIISLLYNNHLIFNNINLWNLGFKSFKLFKEFIENSILEFQQINVGDFKKKLTQNKVLVTDEMAQYLKDNELFTSDCHKLIVMMKTLLINTNSLTKNFMIHSVTSAFNSHGIIGSEVVYGKTVENTTGWLLGDSANSYPPGYSLQNGIHDCFFLIPKLIDVFVLNKSPGKPEKLKNIKKLESVIFSLGERQISYPKVIDMITEQREKTLVDVYNMYQCNNFFSNVRNII